MRRFFFFLNIEFNEEKKFLLWPIIEVNNTFIIHQQNELEPYSNDIVSIWKILRNPGMILMAFQRKNRQKRRQRSSLLFGGQNSLNSLPHYRFSTRMIIIWFTPHQTTSLPIWMFFKNLYFKSSLLLNG